MADGIHKAAPWQQVAPAAAPLRRHIAAWLAILGLYVQLAVAGLCTCGLPVLPDAAGAFPICHGQSGDDNAPAQDDHAPGHHEPCPFCSVHCHAAMVMAPSLATVASSYAVSLRPEPLPFIVPQAARFQAGAPPRGPPTSI